MLWLCTRSGEGRAGFPCEVCWDLCSNFWLGWKSHRWISWLGAVLCNMYIPYFAYLFISWWTFRLFLHLVIMNILLWTVVYKFLCVHVFIFLSYIPNSGIVGSFGKSISIILRNCQIVFQGDHIILHSHQQCMIGFAISSPTFVIVLFFF